MAVARPFESLRPETGADITGLVKKHVAPGSTVYSDEYQSYALIGRLYDENGKLLGYKHDTVKHGQDEYVRGDVHTNSVEGFWSLIKNGIRGVYHQVSPAYLPTIALKVTNNSSGF